MYYATRPEGSEYWYTSREQRNAALSRLREEAIARGLEPSAARNGIVGISAPAAEVEPDGHHVRLYDAAGQEIDEWPDAETDGDGVTLRPRGAS